MLNSQSARLEVVNRLKDDNSLFQNVLDISDEALFIIKKTDNKIVDYNKAARKLFEVDSESSLVDQLVFKLYNFEPMELTLDRLKSNLKEKGEYTQEMSFKSSKGNTFWGKMVQKNLSNSDYSILKIASSTGFLKEQEWLSEVLNVISKATGRNFFKELAKFLTRTYNAKAAFIARRDPGNTSRLKVFYWFGQHEAIKYIPIKNSFVENVLKGFTTYYPIGIHELFPVDEVIQKTKLESFLGSPLFDVSGQTLGVLGVLNDTPMEELPNSRYMLSILSSRASSEMQRLRSQELLRKQAKDLREINQMKDRLLSIITTDLHTPLKTILDYSDIIKNSSSPNGGENYPAKIAAMSHSLRNLYGFVNNVDDWHKLNSGNFKEEIELCNLLEILNDINPYYHYLSVLKKITISNSLNGEEVVLADRHLFGVALRNVITYLIKNTMKAGGVSFEASTCNNKLCLYIKSDHFTGDIADVDSCLSSSFHDLYNLTTESSLPILGLFVVREFMKIQKIKLSYNSENEMISFVFEIPVK